MIRKACILAGSLLVLAPFLVAQGQQIQSSGRFPADNLAPGQLIAWTWMQRPQPMPQLPSQPDNVPPAQAAPPSGNSQPQHIQPTFTGKIEMQGDQLVFRTTEGATYGLNERGNANQYEARNVRISVMLDPIDNAIHIVKIELLP